MFICRLSPGGERFLLHREIKDESNVTCSRLFIATLPCPQGSGAPSAASSSATASQIEVLVKFTDRYNSRAHRLLASADLAPHLYSCSLVCGGLYMVVMALLPGQSMEYLVQIQKKVVPRSVFEDVDAAIRMLHTESIVFGDLRQPNVMCVPESRAESGSGATERLRGMLVDFDWAGADGEGRYPATVDTRRFAAGVDRNGAMRKEHGLEMLARLSAVCGL
ncbi:uncharacterized protein PHACADRAFT_109055 [Phanerochaete carnosa HHB-10118-sp]|uniref:Protein kinase domain-containing protein n=1 Tax=Phanerochaete carnosa (strain HHB-10118-sp) TaxID=650164 RepID=K5VP85_PHACS|nr:uncharacterized protein PHACADRAFT_103739 [Phanerochaete carnosa HHB-10118-sp]XP_007403079.1 uncharacterized protein PHACADRAFT_109055 [Phanerochaete carnosa HHB-10118-sp]EKM48369.1 hypothetical protein PHACADRAFT_109055 [Phanerochaete carnosa HHB-10118-sp]EKM51393.1 hypothetical protein PHACADRAFT_103739 [Phanerochaete carnosa HHB-10118-sp]